VNTIEIRKHVVPSGYETIVFFVDERPLYEYINEWVAGKDELSKSIAPADDLAICWTNEYDYAGDAEFMKFVLNQDKAITPILSCPEDFDFSCIMIVVDLIRQEDKVIWRRIGKVNHSGESFEEEKRSGILNTEAYSEEDWSRYGDNIALADADSPEWCKWISDNWTEELYRRRINYTFPYHQNEKNIEWFAACNFEFDRREYDAVIERCYKN